MNLHKKIEDIKLKFTIENSSSFNKNKVWHKYESPIRSIILWGFDIENNPSLLILYGEHKISNRLILEENVQYTNYIIFKGKGTHIPSFKSIAVSKDYYSKQIKICNKYKKIKDFKQINNKYKIIVPYFENLSYIDYVKIIKSTNIVFDDFKIAQSPNELLKFDNEIYDYCEIVYNIMNNENIYMRKKYLVELIDTNPPKKVYETILNVGSEELICGLFLELAKRVNPILIEEAKILYKTDIIWTDKSFEKGIKRCINIYLNSLDENKKQETINLIYEHLSEIDLNLCYINGELVNSNEIIDGYKYNNYFNQGIFSYYNIKYVYNNETRRYDNIREEKPNIYNPNYYNDGKHLKIIELKNTIQQSEIYKLTDVIGKVAYYLDAPRLTYYFLAYDYILCSYRKEGKYFRQYLKRIIDSYAKNDPDKFMEIMKSLLTSYTQNDYLYNSMYNYYVNTYIMNYLYYDFKYGKSLTEIENLDKRYEFMKEIWDNHLEDVLYIALNAKINTIISACYRILKDNKEFIQTISYKDIAKLAQSSYKPMSNMFTDILLNKLKSLNIFDSEFMITLMKANNEKFHVYAMEYFKRTNGKFSVNDLVNLILLNNFDKWIDLLKENILSLNSNQYLDFIKTFIENADKFANFSLDFLKDIMDIVSLPISLLKTFSDDEKINLVDYILNDCLNKTYLPEFISEFIEEMIFSFTYDELEMILNKVTINNTQNLISAKNKQTIFILETIKNKSQILDNQILSILETGTSKLIKILIQIIERRKSDLKSSTLLIMLETDVKSLNVIAQEVFCNMDKEKQQKLHSIIIDSPNEKVYLYGLKKLDDFYGEAIPEIFIIQMLEHTSPKVKDYISNKTNEVLNNLNEHNKELFMYYVKTLLFLPNKISKGKNNIYKTIPQFVFKYKDKLQEIESILMDIGSSNIILDSERALITLAQVKKGVTNFGS